MYSYSTVKYPVQLHITFFPDCLSILFPLNNSKHLHKMLRYILTYGVHSPYSLWQVVLFVSTLPQSDKFPCSPSYIGVTILLVMLGLLLCIYIIVYEFLLFEK